MDTNMQWVSADLELLPENGKRYEIIDGQLFMSKAPRFEHQRACNNIWKKLDDWSRQTKSGEAFTGSGVIFGDNDDVIPVCSGLAVSDGIYWLARMGIFMTRRNWSSKYFSLLELTNDATASSSSSSIPGARSKNTGS